MLANVKKPYPTERDKALLASRANISPQQVPMLFFIEPNWKGWVLGLKELETSLP